MGWKARVTTLGVGVLLACTGAQPVCDDFFFFQASVSANAVDCVVTFSHADASLAVAVGNLNGGACSAKDVFLPVSCTSDPPEALICNRLCQTGVGEFVLIQADPSSDAGAAQIHTLFGNPAPDAALGASVVCNGTQMDAATSMLLESCQL